MKNKVLKVGALVTILVIPAFLFLMAHILGENHFALPKLISIGVDTVYRDNQVVIDSIYHQVRSIEGLDEENNNFNSKDWRGKIVVYSAIFTNCKDICPLITSNLNKVHSAYLSDTNVAILSLSVDPIRDTPKILGIYKKMYDIENSSWKFLQVLPKENVYDFLIRGLYLSSGEKSGTQMDFFHSENVVLVDGNSFIRGYFDATNAEQVDELIGAIKILKQEDEK